MTIYGYARVSTNGQDLAAQEAELKATGAAKVFKEKVSGAKTDRAELAKVIRRLGPGRCAGRDKAGQAGTLNPRPAQRAGHHRRTTGRLSQPQGRMGGHDHASWPAHVDGARWLGGVRARANPCPYK